MRFLLRKLVFYAVAVWVSVTLNFFLPRLMPGDPATRLFARIADRLTPEQITGLKKVYGLNEGNLWSQYRQYLGHIVRGDLGLSTSRFPTPVTEVIGSGLGWTLMLGSVALILSFTVGTLLGVIGAWRRGGWVDSFLPPILVFAGAFPYFWFAMLCLYVFAFQLGWFPLRGAFDTTIPAGLSLQYVGSVFTHMLLPAGTIIVVSMGGWMLGMRNAMIGTLAEDYVTVAEAKGVPRRRVMLAYAARNAVLPTVTSFGMAFGFIISGALLTEIVFSYPGLGYLLLTSVQNLDYPLIQGLLLILTMAVLAANLLVDLVYVRLDPRVRTP